MSEIKDDWATIKGPSKGAIREETTSLKDIGVDIRPVESVLMEEMDQQKTINTLLIRLNELERVNRTLSEIIEKQGKINAENEAYIKEFESASRVQKFLWKARHEGAKE